VQFRIKFSNINCSKSLIFDKQTYKKIFIFAESIYLTDTHADRKRENIAEYLLFMWQTEDLIRAYKLDIDKIQQSVIDSVYQSVEERKNARDWYEGLIIMMKSEGVQEKGHLQINKNIIIDLTDIHLRLLKDPKESEYIGVYYNTLPYIVELRSKTTDKEVPELETCFTALYGYMLLKIQKKEISKETQAAITQITSLLRLLSKKYNEIDQQE
jgi:hypothetical protein